jgi:hypothetical protein
MAKKKTLGTKAQIRAEKDKERRIVTAIVLAIILLAAAFSAYFGYTILNPPRAMSFTGPTLQFEPENANPKLKAAIVDQVSLSCPNQTLIQTVASMLEQANYSVDYYSGEEVTVDFYRDLPTHNYSLVILRVHSGTFEYQGERIVTLFTSEVYSNRRYAYEQLTDQIGEVLYDQTSYFGIGQGFLRLSAKGSFDDATIVMMGCNGLTNTKMAEAFIEKGAKTYISWSGSISESYADQATIQLLQHLVVEGQTIKQAVENTMKEVGSDPDYSNALEYYPSQSGNYAIQN